MNETVAGIKRRFSRPPLGWKRRLALCIPVVIPGMTIFILNWSRESAELRHMELAAVQFAIAMLAIAVLCALAILGMAKLFEKRERS